MANEVQLAILQRGVQFWNTWRAQTGIKEVDLSGADLSDGNFRLANLSGADLSNTNLRKSKLYKANLSHANLSNAELHKAHLYKANLSRVNFLRANLLGANVKQADFKGADLHKAECLPVNFNESNLSESNLSGAELFGVKFQDANLQGANLEDANLEGANFVGANLANANLKSATLKSANLANANLANANLANANLANANLEGASFYLANFHGAILTTANLNSANLKLANLYEVNLEGSDLHGANLSYTVLEQTILIDSNLSGVTGLGANFIRSDLTGSCIKDWHINSETKFKDIQCDYVFRGLRPKRPSFNNPKLRWESFNRQPSNINKVFKPGEFEQWIKVSETAQQTIDLTFTDGIDWQAFFQSLQGVREKYPESYVGLQAIEKKGSAFVIRVEAAPEADRGAIESTQKELYAESQTQLHKAQGQISAYENVIESMVKTMADNQSKITQNFNAPVGSVAGTNKGEMKAVQHNYPGEIRQTPAESAKEIQDLLLQLQQSNPTDIQTLVEQQIKSDPTLRKRLKNAFKEGGLETLKVIFPLTGIAIETVRGWVEAEGD